MLVVSFMVRSRSGGELGRWPLVTGVRLGRPALMEGASAGRLHAVSGPAGRTAQRRRGGASGLALLFEERHLEALAQEDLHASGDAACEADEGEHGSPPDGSTPFLRHRRSCLGSTPSDLPPKNWSSNRLVNWTC